MDTNERILDFDLLKIAKLMIGKIWIIILSCLLCGVALFSYAYFLIDPTYQSSALFYVNNSDISVGSASVKLSSTDLSTSKSLIDTYVVILKTRNTLETVIKKNNLDYSYEQLRSMISASSVNNTEVFNVTVTSTSPEEACKIANAIAKVFPDKISEIVTGSSAKIVDYAVVNGKKVGPNIQKYTLFGALFGAVISCVAIYLADLFDDTIKDENRLIETCDDIPILAIIPDLESDSKSGYYSQYYCFDDEKEKKKQVTNSKNDGTLLCDAMHFDAKEAYKLLRTNITFCLPDNSTCRKIGITSAIRGEGKSTVAVNLAYALVQTGSKVLLMDMDMRLPSIANKLSFEQGLGLSDVLIGSADFASCVKSSKKYVNWHIISSGSIPPVPSELIGSANMKALMKQLETTYDYIVCDLPPVNVVTDASVAKDILDGFVIAVREGYSDKRSINDCMRQLKLIGANTLGFVLDNSNINNSYSKNYTKYYKKNKQYSYKYYKNDSSKDDK